MKKTVIAMLLILLSLSPCFATGVKEEQPAKTASYKEEVVIGVQSKTVGDESDFPNQCRT